MADEEITTPGAARLAASFQNPAVLNEMNNRLGSLIGKSSGYIDSLPNDVKQRLNFLMNLQDKNNEIEAEFKREILELEKKYHLKHGPLYEKRKDVISGKYEPTAQECHREDQESEETPQVAEKTTGIPEFWLTCLKNVDQIAEKITEEDEEALKSLIDIKISYLDGNPGFKIEFVFKENEFFNNSSLFKTYFLTESPDPSFGDVVYDHAEGTTIDWKADKDLSVKVEVKKQRHKATNKTRTVKKTVPKETFFSFFTPPKTSDEEEEDEDLDDLIELDYEMGEFIKEKLVPNAIDWFTGKALEYDSEGDYEGKLKLKEEEMYDEDDEDEDDDDAPGAGGNPPDCKQQ